MSGSRSRSYLDFLVLLAPIPIPRGEIADEMDEIRVRGGRQYGGRQYGGRSPVWPDR